MQLRLQPGAHARYARHPWLIEQLTCAHRPLRQRLRVGLQVASAAMHRHGHHRTAETFTRHIERQRIHTPPSVSSRLTAIGCNEARHRNAGTHSVDQRTPVVMICSPLSRCTAMAAYHGQMLMYAPSSPQEIHDVNTGNNAASADPA